MSKLINSKILVVDDNLSNLQMIGSTLKIEGYSPIVTSSGIEALEVLGKEKPDLILLDVMMPEIDGFEVARKIKTELGLDKIPIIFITAKTELEDILEGFNAGCVDYIAKPFHTQELLVRVKTHLELKRAREEVLELRGIIPVCASCREIRDDKGVWQKAIDYISKHSSAELSHGLCNHCMEELYEGEEWFDEWKEEQKD